LGPNPILIFVLFFCAFGLLFLALFGQLVACVFYLRSCFRVSRFGFSRAVIFSGCLPRVRELLKSSTPLQLLLALLGFVDPSTCVPRALVPPRPHLAFTWESRSVQQQSREPSMPPPAVVHFPAVFESIRAASFFFLAECSTVLHTSLGCYLLTSFPCSIRSVLLDQRTQERPWASFLG
jgi:hypothetical protein